MARHRMCSSFLLFLVNKGRKEDPNNTKSGPSVAHQQNGKMPLKKLVIMYKLWWGGGNTIGSVHAKSTCFYELVQ